MHHALELVAPLRKKSFYDRHAVLPEQLHPKYVE